MKEIIKALGFDPLPTAIITIQLTVIWFFLRNFYETQKANQQETQKNILENFNKVIETRKEEIEIVKDSIQHLSKDIGEIKNNIKLNNDTTTLLAYHQCMNEAMKWKEKGEIPMGAKMHFETVWRQYEKLGDGHGTDPKDMIDTLKVVA